MQEGQPYEIVHSGNISLVSSFNTVFQSSSVFEGKFMGATTADLDLSPSTASTTAGSQTSEACLIQTRSPGWAIPSRVRVDLQPRPIQGKLETTALPGPRSPQLSTGNYYGSRAAPPSPVTVDLRCLVNFFAFDPELAIEDTLAISPAVLEQASIVAGRIQWPAADRLK